MIKLAEHLRLCADHAATEPERRCIADPADRRHWASVMEQAADRIEFLEAQLLLVHRTRVEAAPDHDEIERRYSDIGVPRIARMMMAWLRPQSPTQDDAA